MRFIRASAIALLLVICGAANLRAQSGIGVFPSGSGLISSGGTNGGLYRDVNGNIIATATGGAGTLCFTSANGGIPVWGACSGSAATAFSALTSSTNTSAAMVVGSGGSLSFSGTGVNNANEINGTAFAGTNGHLVSFGASNIPADSGLVAANEVNASSPGIGLCHFAGSTQTCTSSLIVAADITSATITGTQIASSITLAGTPTITGTNITGVPISTGISGLGTGVATLLGGTASGTGGPAGTASPTFTGTITGAAETLTGTLTTNVTGSTQCLHVNTSGVVSGTGSDCGSGGGGANTALSNLASVSINTSLVPQAGVALGAAGTPFTNIFFYGGTTFGTDSIEITGTPTTNRVWTVQDATDTFVGRATTDTLTNKTLTTPTIGSFTNATHNHTNAAGGGQLNITTASNATGTPSSTTFLRGDNSWAAAGGTGTVTVVSAGNLTSTDCVTGGGSQTIQTPSANCTIDSSGNLVANSLTTGSGPAVTGTGVIGLAESTGQTCPAGADCALANSTAHTLLLYNNGTEVGPFVGGPTSAPTSGDVASFNGTTGASIQDAGGPLPANTTSTTNQFFTAYTQSTGAFTKAQPTWAGLASPAFVSNPQTATYQVLAADFTQCKTIPVASGTFTVTLVASGSQPANGQCLYVINYGSGVVTIARSGQNLNGGTSSLSLAAASATAPTGAFIVSDGTNYEAALFGASSGGSGTVTSVALTTPSWLTVGGSPVTTSGTLAVTATTGQTSHQVIGTCGSATTFAPCSLVAGDIPALNQNTTGSAGSVPLSGITGAGASNTIANGNNPQVWNAAQTTNNQTFFTFGETTAATGTTDVELAVTTLATSTAIPLKITQGTGIATTGNPVASALTVTGGAGGAVAATAAGNTGGPITLTTGAGSAGGATSGTGGAGGALNLTAGNGGAATAGSTTGAGGNIVLTPGSAGGTGTAGAPGQVQIAGATVGAALTTPFLNITGTWNTTGVVDAAIFANITNTASGAASKLMDLQASSTSEFSVDKAGNGLFTTSVGTGTAPACTAGTAGAWCAGEGTAFTNVASTAGIYPDSTAHEFMAKTNGASTAGILERTQPGAIKSTGLTASVSTATLCAASAGSCNVAGQYKVHVTLYQSGSACTANTTNGVSFQLTWTDGNGTAHSAQTIPLETNGSLTALTGTMAWGATTVNAYASADFNIDTNGTILQYATTYASCTTGTATYALDASVSRIQ